jgi:hypothetical protein
MFKAISLGASLLFLALMVFGSWDLLRGAKPLVAAIALIFVVAGILNTVAALNQGSRN